MKKRIVHTKNQGGREGQKKRQKVSVGIEIGASTISCMTQLWIQNQEGWDTYGGSRIPHLRWARRSVHGLGLHVIVCSRIQAVPSASRTVMRL